MANDVQILSLEGELTAAATPVVQQKLSALIEGGHAQIVVDMAGVSFMSSAGIRVLTVATKLVRQKGVTSGWPDCPRSPRRRWR